MLSKTCENCGKIFYKDNNRSKRDFLKRARFCSNKCKVYKQKGFYKHWQGKKRPELINTGSAKTMFYEGQPSSRKGTGIGTELAKRKLTTYRANAKRVGRKFEVTLKQMRDFLNSKCVYCGEQATGIDRVDNTKGYTKGNMEPCCGICNHMKNNLSKEDFIKKVRQIVTCTGYEI